MPGTRIYPRSFVNEWSRILVKGFATLTVLDGSNFEILIVRVSNRASPGPERCFEFRSLPFEFRSEPFGIRIILATPRQRLAIGQFISSGFTGQPSIRYLYVICDDSRPGIRPFDFRHDLFDFRSLQFGFRTITISGVVPVGLPPWRYFGSSPSPISLVRSALEVRSNPPAGRNRNPSSRCHPPTVARSVRHPRAETKWRTALPLTERA